MLPPWLSAVFGLGSIAGLFFLVRSIKKLVSIYNAPFQVTFPASNTISNFEIKEPGKYEIAVKRPSLFGIIPYKIPMHVANFETNEEIPVHQKLNLFGQRQNLSGARIVPVAEFVATRPGRFQLRHDHADQFKENDMLIIMPATGSKGFMQIFVVLFSSFLFIGGMVLTILSLLKKI